MESIMAMLQNLQQIGQEVYMAVIFNPFACSILFTSLLLLHSLIINRRSKLNLPPAPRKLPIIGHLHHLGKLRHRSLKALSEKYGPLMFLCLGQTPTLVASSEETAKEVMKTHDLVFLNRPQITAARVFLYGCNNISFCPYGEYWRKTKKLCVLELLSLRRVQSFQYVREEEVAALIDKLRCACRSSASVDLSEMLLAVANNITSRCVVGRKAEEECGKNNLGELSRRMLTQFAAFSFGDLFPTLGWMDKITGLYGQMQATARQLDAFLEQVIEEHKIVDSDDVQHGRKDLVHVILQLQRDGTLGVRLTRDNVKAILLDMFVGGTDTTATLMEWVMAELTKNKNVMRKAQEEVRSVAGKKSKIPSFFPYVDKMNYLKCIIKETLRLHPPLPLLVPRQTSTSVQLSGYTIPPKTTLLINAHAIHMDPKVWKSPEKFIPERFEKEQVDFKAQVFNFLPFGGGRRGCPGISFGVISAEFVLANLLYWFDWTLPGGQSPEDLDMSECYGLTVTKKDPLHLMPAMYSP